MSSKNYLVRINLSFIIIILFILQISGQGTISPTDNINNDSSVIIKKQIVVNEVAYTDLYVKYFTGIFIAPVLPFDVYKNDSLSNKYDSTHYYRPGMQYSINQGVEINSFYASAGISYLRYPETFHTCLALNKVDTTYPSADSSLFLVTTTQNDSSVQMRNIHQYLNIPVIVGKKFEYKHAYCFVQIGISINLFLNAEEKVELSQNTVQKISKNYYNTIQLALLSGIGVGYKISNAVHFYMQPWFMYGLTPPFLLGDLPRFKTHVSGLNIGLQIMY